MLNKNIKNCCGCGACIASCPQNAISFINNENGFLVPKTDKSLCVNCGICESLCNYPANHFHMDTKQIYAAVANNTSIVESASGGVFSGIAKEFLNKGGAVAGCSLRRDADGFKAEHIVITDEKELSKLKGSKYIHSNTIKSYVQTRELLGNGISVLYSGTPCQIAGLYSYLGKRYSNLYTIDIVCHGVPSEKMFNDYISLIERKLNTIVDEFVFRDKSRGWQLFGKMHLTTSKRENDTVYFMPEESSYYQLFLEGLTYRDNCYSCPFAGKFRPGDLTIGDYWGIEIVQPELLAENGGPLNKYEGISCLMVNNKHGADLLREYAGVSLFESSFELISRYNRQLKTPSSIPSNREIVFQKYRKSYKHLDNWYRRRLGFKRIKRFVRNSIPSSIKSVIKKHIYNSNVIN